MSGSKWIRNLCDTATMKKWMPLILLACTQFVMVLDSSVMNVSISQIVTDLDTTIEGVQLAITAYTLVMAAFMLVGAKIGDIWGCRKALIVGSMVYATGSLITAISPSLPVLLFGWSLIEGLGAALVMPAIAALIVNTYEGRERALSYGVIGGISGAAIAVGPVIGGWVTTSFTWRYVFVAEVVVLITVLSLRRFLTHVAPTANAQLDVRGAALSALGLSVLVFGVLKSSTWGWLQPLNPPQIGGRELAPLGFSPVAFVILIGFGVLWMFARGLDRRRQAGQPVLIDLSMLSIPDMRSGLSTLLMQQLILLGTFFVLPVYLQVVLGLNAFETGVKLLPLSLALLLFAMAGPRMAAKRSPRTVVWIGLVCLASGALTLASAVDAQLDQQRFNVGLALLGAGAGLLMSQLGNVIMSSVGADKSNEAGGLQGTAQNLGASLGTALVGSVLLAGLSVGFVKNIEESSVLPTDVKSAIVAKAESNGVGTVPLTTIRKLATDAGLEDDEVEAVVDSYGTAQLKALRTSLFVVGIFALLAFWPSRRLPSSPLVPDKVASA